MVMPQLLDLGMALAGSTEELLVRRGRDSRVSPCLDLAKTCFAEAVEHNRWVQHRGSHLGKELAVVVGEGLGCLAGQVGAGASGAVEDHVVLVVEVALNLVLLVLLGLPLYHRKGCLVRGRWKEELGREQSFGQDRQEHEDYLLGLQAHDEAA